MLFNSVKSLIFLSRRCPVSSEKARPPKYREGVAQRILGGRPNHRKIDDFAMIRPELTPTLRLYFMRV